MAILKEKVGLTKADLRKLRAMRPGLTLDLQVSSPTGMKRVRTEFVGMDGTRSLIIKFPDEGKWGSLRDAIYADNSLVIRYILEDEAGEIVAFKVNINLVLSKPGHYIFTTFPLSIQCHTLRSEQRNATKIPANLLSAKTGANLGEGKIIDLSNSGCRLSVRHSAEAKRLPTDFSLKLHINTADKGSDSLLGTVKNVKNDELYYYYGIKFDASEEAVAALRQRLLLN